MGDEATGETTRDRNGSRDPRRRNIVAALAVVTAVTVGAVAWVAAAGDDTDDAGSPSTTSSGTSEPWVSAEPTESFRDDVSSSAETESPAAGTSTSTSTAPQPTASSNTNPDDTLQEVTGTDPLATATPQDPLPAPDAETITAALDDVLQETDRVVGSDPVDAGEIERDLTDVATGAVLSEIEATRAEFDAMGWSLVGAPSIVSLEIVATPDQDTPDEIVVEVCLDSADVRVLDENGDDVRPASGDTRSLNIYVLRSVEGHWLPAMHTFPDDPTC